MSLIIEIISAGLLASTPIMLAALGGSYTYHADVFNISMEGQILTASFLAVAVSYFTGSWILGVVAAIIGTAFLSLLFALSTIKLDIDEFVTGIAINMLALGGTTYALRRLFGVKGAFASKKIAPLPPITIPIVKDIPILGDILSGYHLFVYITIIFVFIVSTHIFKSVWGLRLRAVGKKPEAALTVGVSVKKMRIQAIFICGILCGFAGTALSLGNVALFTENMSNGRGWIALTLIVLTLGKPFHMLGMGILFGIFDGMSFSLQDIGIPSQLTATLPYLMTLVALFFYSKKKNISIQHS